MIEVAAVPVAKVQWREAVRIIRSLYPPIDLFEDIADPADWPLLISAEQKTNPRLMETTGNLDLVPPGQAQGGTWRELPDGALHPFQRRPAQPFQRRRRSAFSMPAIPSKSRYSRRFFTMAGSWRAPTNPPDGPRNFARSCSTSTRDCTISEAAILTFRPALDPDEYAQSQALGARLRAVGSDGLVYPSVRLRAAQCVGLFYPDCAANPIQGRHLDYHWDGARVDLSAISAAVRSIGLSNFVQAGVFDRVNASDLVADGAKRFDATPARVDERMSRYGASFDTSAPARADEASTNRSPTDRPIQGAIVQMHTKVQRRSPGFAGVAVAV